MHRVRVGGQRYTTIIFWQIDFVDVEQKLHSVDLIIFYVTLLSWVLKDTSSIIGSEDLRSTSNIIYFLSS